MDSNAPLRVLIADDEPIIRDVARMACEEHGAVVVGEAAGGFEAVAETLRLQPDVLILDLDLHDIDGFEVSRRLRDQGCAVQILGTTGEGGPPAMFRAIRTGISGVLSRAGMATNLPDSLRALAGSGRAISPAHQDLALAQFGAFLTRARTRAGLSARLTKRERAVLGLIVDGLTTRQMASRLQLSEGTVESHITSAYRKLSVRTRVQAAAKAVGAGIADLRQGPRTGPPSALTAARN